MAKRAQIRLFDVAAQQPRRRLTLVRRPSGVVAMERARQLARDFGEEKNYEWGWKAHAARRMGLPYSTAWQLIEGHLPALGTRTVDMIARATGCPVSALYDEEYES